MSPVLKSETNENKDFVYYESIKRELKRRLIYECRCDERLKTKTEESTRLAYTGLLGGLEHLKIETMLIDDRFIDFVVCFFFCPPFQVLVFHSGEGQLSHIRPPFSLNGSPKVHLYVLFLVPARCFELKGYKMNMKCSR